MAAETYRTLNDTVCTELLRGLGYTLIPPEEARLATEEARREIRGARELLYTGLGYLLIAFIFVLAIVCLRAAYNIYKTWDARRARAPYAQAVRGSKR